MDAKLSADIDRLHAMITPEMRRAADPYLYELLNKAEAFRKALLASLWKLEDFDILINVDTS